MANANDATPYAPLKNVLDLLHRLRNGRLPEVMDSTKLVSMGVPAGNVTRVSHTLRWLGLVDEAGKQTEELALLGKGSDEEYRKLLASYLEKHYSHVFDVIPDITTATEESLVNAFRWYEPGNQRTRMITLFVGLCEEAGLLDKGAINRKGAPKDGKPSQPRYQRSANPRSAHVKSGEGSGGEPPPPEEKPESETGKRDAPPPTFQGSGSTANDAILNQLFQLYRQLIPSDFKWTTKRRLVWLKGFESGLDALVETEDEQPEAVSHKPEEPKQGHGDNPHNPDVDTS